MALLAVDDDDAALRTRLHRALADARRRTDEVFSLVRDEALHERPVPERHRLAFYIGHLEAFDANLLLRDTLGRITDRPDWDRLFAFGIDPSGAAALPTDEAHDWPSVAELRLYVARRRADLDQALEDVSLTHPLHPNLQDGWALRLAIEHRLMHAETLAYLVHQLPSSARKPGPAPEALSGEVPERTFVEIPEGRTTLGLPRGKAPF